MYYICCFFSFFKLMKYIYIYIFFFFQAVDGIRDFHVTGVQTCALPISTAVHTRLPFVMAYDLEPARTVETKRTIFERAIAEDWIVLWGHDLQHHGGRLAYDKDGKPVVREFVKV